MEPPDGGGGGGGGKKQKGEAASAGEAIGDDLLGDILLRLPDTATLARAALACKRWRCVASNPALLRRFHSLHAPPLVGVILSDIWKPFSCCGPNLLFVSTHSCNPHLAVAAGAGDFLFEGLADGHPRSGSVVDEWLLRGCDVGLLLLSNDFGEYEKLAVYDPLARTADFFRRPDAIQFNFDFRSIQYALVSDESDASFRVVAAQFYQDRVTAAVFSSRTGDWAPLPSFGAPCPWNARDAKRAGRFAYWQSSTSMRKYSYSDIERTLVLDTSTMEWSLIQAPFDGRESYCVADMAEHGGLCLVASKEQCVQLWVRKEDGWVIKKEVSLLKEFGFLKKLRHDEWMKRVRILAARDGHVYLEFWSIRKPNSYLLVLNWETMKLAAYRNDSTEPYRGPAFPFFISWAPPLLSPADERILRLQGV